MRRFILVGFLLIVKGHNIYEDDIYWREYNKSIPEDAVHVGYGLYIGTRVIDGNLIPGTIYPKTGKFITEHFGKKETIDGVKIMCSQEPSRFQWEYVNFHGNALPENLLERLVAAGYQNNSLNWYIGRGFHQNEWRIGKVDIFNVKSLLIWNNDGTLHRLFNFEILTDVNKIVNTIQSDVSSDLRAIKEELSNKNGYYFSSLAEELDGLPERFRDLIKTAIWRVIYKVKRSNVNNITLSLSDLVD
nr:uncharacterized protein LOC111413819 [Onthophagus taurus]